MIGQVKDLKNEMGGERSPLVLSVASCFIHSRLRPTSVAGLQVGAAAAFGGARHGSVSGKQAAEHLKGKLLEVHTHPVPLGNDHHC